MKKFFLLLIVLCSVCLVSCGGSSSSSGPDGGVSGWGFYDFFNGHTWYHIDGNSKDTFTFSDRKVARKIYSNTSGNWVEVSTTSEKSYTLSDITGDGAHGTITTEDLFENHPTRYVFLTSKQVVLTYNNYTATFYTD